MNIDEWIKEKKELQKYGTIPDKASALPTALKVIERYRSFVHYTPCASKGVTNAHHDDDICSLCKLDNLKIEDL